MLFNSYIFIFAFLPITLLLFNLARRWLDEGAARIFLVAASLVFYGYWNAIYIILILGSISVNFGIGRLFDRPDLTARERKAALILGLAVNLGALAFFKYAFFISTNLALLFPAPTMFEWVVLPLAISFYTFQQIAYLVEVYRGWPAERNPVNYALMVLFFPHLIAGPIVHPREILPQIRSLGRSVDTTLMALGLAFFAFGLFKKAVLADSIAPYATSVFDAAYGGARPDFFQAWQGALAYTFQLYFDFSGYCDMAIGLALLFGIRFPVNFNAPYQALSISDFWRRWHITLSRFLRNYLYIPLGGNRQGPTRRHLNLMATMMLGGLWHGAGWTFFAWGCLHGLYLVVDHGWQAFLGRLGIAVPRSGIGRVPGWALTFLAVVVAWVFFRAPDFATAGRMLAGMVGLNGAVLPGAYGYALGPLRAPFEAAGIVFGGGAGVERLAAFGLILLLFALSVFGPTTQQILRYHGPEPELVGGVQPTVTEERAPGLGLAVLTGVLAAFGILALTSVSEFLYFQF